MENPNWSGLQRWKLGIYLLPAIAAYGVVRRDRGFGQECFCPCLQTPLVIFLESAGRTLKTMRTDRFADVYR